LVQPPAESVHILDYYFAVLETIGVSEPVSTITLTASETARQSLQTKLESHDLSEKKFLVLIPGSAHGYKCWPTERFAEAARHFHQEYGWPAVVVGTKNESHFAKTITDNTSSPVIDLTGQTSIPELVVLFDSAGAVISNDTGPGHIALASDTPGVVIFGNTNPLRLGPYQRAECVVAIDADKRGAEIKDTKPAHHIENITVKMVLDKLESQLRE
jgi:ADP-heptose:LPS heptosyltransferase